MTCDVISTGSKGNAVVLGGEILIDCGVPFKLLERYIWKLRIVLLTHQHRDHINPATVRRLHQTRPTLRFGCCHWMVEHLLAAGVAPQNIDVMEPDVGYAYVSAGWLIQPFPLWHDVENCGYFVDIGNERALYATDTGSLDHVEAKGLDLYLIEANHTEEEIAERIRRKLAAGEFVYEYRAQSGHLSREKADSWLAANATPGRSRVVYLHQHQD